MSSVSASSRASSSRSSAMRRPSGQSLPPPPPSHHSSSHMPPPPPSGIDHVRLRTNHISHREPLSTRSANAQPHSNGYAPRSNGRQSVSSSSSAQKESVMARNRQPRAPTAAVPEHAVTVRVSIVGAAFKCLVERDWPCESLVASAIAEYHLAYPTCEVPDCSFIFHVGRKQVIEPKDPVGKWCRDSDEIELGIKERPVPAAAPSQQRPMGYNIENDDPQLHLNTFDFTIVFHRLPLGFTLKQEMDATVVANIYPKSAGTHYERLEPGVIVVKIGDTPLEFLGLRQVHEVIRNCKLPLHIRFRGWRKPTQRRASFSRIADAVVSPKATPTPTPPQPPPQRRKSAPNRAPLSAIDANADADDADTNTNSSARCERSNTVTSSTSSVTAAQAIITPPLVLSSASETSAQTAQSPSPYSQRLSTERKKTNASSPYPEHRVVAAERRARRDSTGVDLSVPLADQLETASNQGDSPHNTPSSSSSPPSSPSAIAELKTKQREFHRQGAPLPKTPTNDDEGNGHLNSVDNLSEQLTAARISERRTDDVDSNQNEDESEEMLAKHIKILQTELAKKYEEAKLLADQLQKYHARFAAAQSARIKRERRPSVTNGHANSTQPKPAATTTVPASSSAKPTAKPKLTLTPEVLEAMDTTAGLPPKDGQYAGSNASSVSGYSSYSNRSKRHSQQLSRVVGRTGETATSMRGDASVSSIHSASRSRSRGGSFSEGSALKSPRSQVVQNINNRYNYIPQTYSASDKFYDAPSSFSTKGGLISRAKATRDSYIQIPDTPGVGAYDVKLPRDKVRGGEIGDSDRSLPWP